MRKHEHIEYANKILTKAALGSMCLAALIGAAFVILAFQPGVRIVRCADLGSYEDAVFFFKHLHLVDLDGDGDGIPCENLYNKQKKSL